MKISKSLANMKKIIIFIFILLLANLVLIGGSCGNGENGEEDEIELKMDRTAFNKGEMITAIIESKNPLFVDFLTFGVYQLKGYEWEYVYIYDISCNLPCSMGEEVICSEPPVVCDPLPIHCQDFDPKSDKFEWDGKIYGSREIECPGLDEERYCTFTEQAEPGEYKIVFKYSENCVNKDLFEAEENNVQMIQKEFLIRPEYIKVDDFFGEWPIYYDKYVEFEGYVTSVYECMPPERCLEPYFLVYKEPLSYRYFSTGQVIIKHRFGEELEINKKYRIRGKLLPPEQAFLIEIVGTLSNAESRIVIEPTEPAVEI